METYSNRIAALICAFLWLGPISNAQIESDRHEDYARAHVSWALYHETGHAIQDFTADRFVMSKLEREIHADKVAAYLMMPEPNDAARWQLYYDAAADLLLDPDAQDPSHGYESSPQRAERMYCMLYGAYPNHPSAQLARQLKSTDDQACIDLFQSFKAEAEDILGFAEEETMIEGAPFIDPIYYDPDQRNANAADFLDETEILEDLGIDVEQWLPGLRVSDDDFQIVARECAGRDGFGYDGFYYKAELSAVVACYAAVQRCMNRPLGMLMPTLEEQLAQSSQWHESDDWNE